VTPPRLVRPKPAKFHRHWQLTPRIAFLNHGSFGACPKAILQLQARFRSAMEAEPVQFLWRRYEERLEPARQELARFVGAKAKDLVFLPNATTGVNAVVHSLQLRRGDEVLTTNQDYNACHNVLVEAVRQAGAKLVVAKVPFPLNAADEITAAILSSVTRRTRLALLDHVTSNTALIFPLKPILRELEARGVETLVDGAHAPGMLPLSLRDLRPTYYTANLHKWVCAPKGAGFLWVREDKQAGLQPAVISHGNNRPRPGFTPLQDRFDWAGTFDPSAWFCVGKAIRFIGGLLPGGWPELYQRNHDLVVAARRMLCQRLQIEPPCPEWLLGSMATLPLPERLQRMPPSGKIDREQLRLYDEFGIEVPLSRFGEPPRRWFRISAQLYNSPAEYKYLAGALEQI
jgi:isopenicillin-N epimerase